MKNDCNTINQTIVANCKNIMEMKKRIIITIIASTRLSTSLPKGQEHYEEENKTKINESNTKKKNNTKNINIINDLEIMERRTRRRRI